MYYYLFEPNSPSKESNFSRVKSLVSLHGIVGEMATPSPSRPLEDLVTYAAEKGYNTVVAVGGGGFLTSVAKLLAKSDLAVGCIPIGASPELQDLLGVKTLDQAVLSLKQRKVSETGLGVIAPGRVFLLSAHIHTKTPSPVIIESKTFRVEGSFTQLTIERKDTVTIRFSDRSAGHSVVRKFASWLIGRSASDPTETALRSSTLSVATPHPLDILVEDAPFAKTPCKIRVSPRALKLIQARTTIASDQP